MFKIKILLMFVIMSSLIIAQDKKTDEAKIKKIIQTAYVDGLQNLGDLKETEKGFHPGFNLLGVNRNNSLTKFPIYTWIELTKGAKDKQTEKFDEKDFTTCTFEFIDITGNAAVAKIYLYQHKKKIFTDYLSLYRFGEDWKIVSKIYYRTPPPPPSN